MSTINEGGAQKDSKQHLREVTIGELPRHDAQVTLTEYSTEWPTQYERDAEGIRSTLGGRGAALGACGVNVGARIGCQTCDRHLPGGRRSHR